MYVYACGANIELYTCMFPSNVCGICISLTYEIIQWNVNIKRCHSIAPRALHTYPPSQILAKAVR